MNSVMPDRRPSAWLATGCVLATLIVSLSLSRTIVELPGDGGGRYAHAIAYAALMFTFAQAYTTTRSRIVVAAALIALGVCLEILQGWTGYRNYERGDMVANAAGVALGWCAERTLGMLESLRRLAKT